MFRKMPFILFALMIFIGLSHSYLPLNLKSALYALSLSIKSLIVFTLPFIIFGLLFKTTVTLSKTASQLIILLLVAICGSNFLSTLLSYSVGRIAYGLDMAITFPTLGSELQPSWTFLLPKWIGNDHAMFSGLLFGTLLGLWKPRRAHNLAIKFDKIIGLIMKGFLVVIPLFICGFLIKMYHDNMMGYIIQNYGRVFALTGCSVFTYIVIIYAVGSYGQKVSLIQCLKNMLPATIAGFGSMSSAAAMPLTLIGVEKNAPNPDVARSIIPATVNVHLIGDCFAIPIFAFAVMKSFGVAEPSFLTYLIFSCYFVLAKFSVAAVPGGGILVMLPILEHHLGFNPIMLSLITALYILFDPIITSANVLGNGGFAIALSKLSKPIKKAV
jgi:Na+/H+-dicarboxylate symporter